MSLLKKTCYICIKALIVLFIVIGFQKTGQAYNGSYSNGLMQLRIAQSSNSSRRKRLGMDYSMNTLGYPLGRQSLRLSDMGGFSHRRAYGFNRMRDWGNTYSPSGRQSLRMSNMGGFSHRHAYGFNRMRDWENTYSPLGRQSLRMGDMGGFFHRRAYNFNRMRDWGNTYSPLGRQSLRMGDMGGFFHRRAYNFNRMRDWGNIYVRP